MKKIKNKNRKFIPFLAIIFIIIIVLAILFLWYAFSGNYINIENKDNSAENVTKEDAKNSDLILINGFVVGAVKDSKWISSKNYYEENAAKSDIELELYSDNREYGVFKTASLKRYDNSVIYTTIAKQSMPDKYLGLVKKEEKRIISGMTKVEPTKEDEEYVKEAIGSYKLINGSVKINEVYKTDINNSNDKIICATSKSKNILGVYSAAIFVTNNKPYLIKYSYVRDTNNSDRWKVFNLLFVMDLNNFGSPEIVLQETTGNDISYSILELRNNNKFYEVLNTVIKL